MKRGATMREPSEPIYLDHNATTPILPEVVDAMMPYLRDHFGNPSSGHLYGRRAQRAIATAREQVAELLACGPDEIVFTSGGTEANNLAIRGVMEARPERAQIVTSVIEHPATARPCDWLEQRGCAVSRVGVDALGQLRIDEARDALGDETALVTVMHANNETGVLQPIAEIARWAKDRGAVIHTDAAQSVGKVDLDVHALEVGLLSVAGHKLYAPKGIGALFVRRGTRLEPLLRGAGHESGLRPGTENVASIVGLGVACARARRDLAEESKRLIRLRDLLWARLAETAPGLALNGHPDHRLPDTASIRFPGVTGRELLERAPEIAASTGSACHAGEERASPVILAMGVEPQAALGTVRLTLGRGSTERDIELASAALNRAWSTLTA